MRARITSIAMSAHTHTQIYVECKHKYHRPDRTSCAIAHLQLLVETNTIRIHCNIAHVIALDDNAALLTCALVNCGTHGTILPLTRSSLSVCVCENAHDFHTFWLEKRASDRKWSHIARSLSSLSPVRALCDTYTRATPVIEKAFLSP